MLNKLIEKKNSKKGFTLAELLIVVAIIAVLVAISIPIFTTQLEKSKEATDLANIRAAYADASVAALDNGGEGGQATSAPMTQNAGWTQITNPEVGGIPVTVAPGKGQTVTVTIDKDGGITFSLNGTAQ